MECFTIDESMPCTDQHRIPTEEDYVNFNTTRVSNLEGLLTSEAKKQVNSILNEKKEPLKVVVELFSIKVMTKDLWRLRPGPGGLFLNDIIINVYFRLLESLAAELKANLITFETLVYTLIEENKFKDAMKMIKLTSLNGIKHVLIPIHSPTGVGHWSLVVINVQERKICYYCSLGQYRLDVLQKITNFVKKNMSSVPDLKCEKIDGPMQGNDTDCGVFICTYAKLYVTGRIQGFEQDHHV